jgi:hypothetical protein
MLITAGRRMVEGRPCAEGGSRDPVVRARHPCPMPEPMPSASELPHHSMMRMVRRTTAMPRPAALACYAVLRYSWTSPVLPGTAQQPARAQQQSPVICSRKGLCLSVPCAQRTHSGSPPEGAISWQRAKGAEGAAAKRLRWTRRTRRVGRRVGRKVGRKAESRWPL